MITFKIIPNCYKTNELQIVLSSPMKYIRGVSETLTRHFERNLKQFAYFSTKASKLNFVQEFFDLKNY